MALARFFPVELPGNEPGTKTVLNCGNAQSDCANDAKVLETTCGYVKGVDGVNKNRFPFQGHIHPVRVAYT